MNEFKEMSDKEAIARMMRTERLVGGAAIACFSILIAILVVMVVQ